MANTKTPAWAELLQLIQVVSLALPFILQGAVDLARANLSFLVAALLTIPVTVAVVGRKHLLNPILVGTGLWLWVGAIAFNLSIESIATWLGQTQAFGLFVAALGVGVATTVWSPYGYVACRSSQRGWLRRASLGLLLLNVVMVGVAWVFRHDVRLGGGLPFIVLNVARRALCRRAPP